MLETLEKACWMCTEEGMLQESCYVRSICGDQPARRMLGGPQS